MAVAIAYGPSVTITTVGGENFLVSYTASEFSRGMFGYGTPGKDWSCMDVLFDCCASFAYTERKVVDGAQVLKRLNVSPLRMKKLADSIFIKRETVH